MARINNRSGEAGFTLIEVLLVMAITGALIIIAFSGQQELRSRARFDAAVEKIVSSVATAQTKATAGVNISVGATVGTGVDKCRTGPPLSGTDQVVFAGTSWAADSRSGPNAIFQIDYYKAVSGVPGSACIFNTDVIDLPTDIRITSPPPPNNVSGMLFVRTNTGGVDVCPHAAISLSAFQTQALVSYANASCGNSAASLTVADLSGHSSKIDIDASGLALRRN